MLANTSMYRLMLYYLLLLVVAAAVINRSVEIVTSALLLVVVANMVNLILAKVVGTKINLESATITALILSLIAGPFAPIADLAVIVFLAAAAMVSKYILVIRRKHLLNPAAVAVLASALVLDTGASWWVGTNTLLPIILIGGSLVLFKIKRAQMVFAFVLVYVAITGNTLSAPVWFLALVMLVEPLTTPGVQKYQIVYGAMVGALVALLPQRLPNFQFGFESSLIVGNLVFGLIAPRANFVLCFREKRALAGRTWRFVFAGNIPRFQPGQYMEWTIAHKYPDSRGFRRFFTIASPPQKNTLAIAVNISQNSSSFKKALIELKQGDSVLAHGPDGEFVLPDDTAKKLCFIAGGIGVTPFVSMSGYLRGRKERRDIVLLYIVRQKGEVAYHNLFAQEIRYETKKHGHLTADAIAGHIPDYQSRVFYVSGPTAMVTAIKAALLDLGITEVKTDYFPGY